MGQAQQAYAKEGEVTDEEKGLTFEKKFGLEGKGTKVQIPEGTRRLNELLDEVSETITKAGENWTKGFKGTFGR